MASNCFKVPENETSKSDVSGQRWPSKVATPHNPKTAPEPVQNGTFTAPIPAPGGSKNPAFHGIISTVAKRT